MARVDPENASARFRVVVWRTPDSTELTVGFTDFDGARDEFEKLKCGGQFYYGEFVEWQSDDMPWKLIDSWDNSADDSGDSDR